MVFILTANSQIEIDEYRWICELAVFLARKDAKAQVVFIITTSKLREIYNHFCEFYKSSVLYWSYIYN